MLTHKWVAGPLTALAWLADAQSIGAQTPASAPSSSQASSDVVRVWQTGTWSNFSSAFPLTGLKDEDEYDDPAVQAPRMPPFTSAYAKRWQAVRNEAFKGRNVLDVGTRCVPLGIPFTAGFGLIQILFAPDRIVTTGTSDNGIRVIYTDGRPHRKDADPSFNGDSIGHWEGKTLVVDTVNLHPDTYIEVGMPHGPNLHVIERWTPVDDSTFRVDVTLEDPAEFTQPVHESSTWKHDPAATMAEDVCENSRDKIVNGATTMIGPDGKPLTAPAHGKAHYKIVQQDSSSK